jgi:hypothetical protein
MRRGWAGFVPAQHAHHPTAHFHRFTCRRSSAVIEWMVDNQDAEFGRLGLNFQRLLGRRLHLIDCQNLFCEISKYARVAHPGVCGLSRRRQIKQVYRVDPRPLPPIALPKRWGGLGPLQQAPLPGSNAEVMRLTVELQ